MFNKEIVIPIVVLALSYAFFDPFMVLMPTAFVYTIMVLFFLVYIGFTLLVWHESARDERELAHRAYADRIAHLIGTGVLVIGIIYQAFTAHSVDTWLILALSVMVIAKYFALRYYEAKD